MPLTEFLVQTAAQVASYSHALAAQFTASAATHTAADVLFGRPIALADLEYGTNEYLPWAEDGATVMQPVRFSRKSRRHRRAPCAAEELAYLELAGTSQSALRALAAGLGHAVEHPKRVPVADLITKLAVAREPGPAAVALALIGAARGLEALAPDLVDRLDVGHVADQLAIDVDSYSRLREASELPLSWRLRYPEW